MCAQLVPTLGISLLPELGKQWVWESCDGTCCFGKRWTLLMLEFAVSLTFQRAAVLSRVDR